MSESGFSEWDIVVDSILPKGTATNKKSIRPLLGVAIVGVQKAILAIILVQNPMFSRLSDCWLMATNDVCLPTQAD